MAIKATIPNMSIQNSFAAMPTPTNRYQAQAQEAYWDYQANKVVAQANSDAARIAGRYQLLSQGIATVGQTVTAGLTAYRQAHLDEMKMQLETKQVEQDLAMKQAQANRDALLFSRQMTQMQNDDLMAPLIAQAQVVQAKGDYLGAEQVSTSLTNLLQNGGVTPGANQLLISTLQTLAPYMKRYNLGPDQTDATALDVTRVAEDLSAPNHRTALAVFLTDDKLRTAFGTRVYARLDQTLQQIKDNPLSDAGIQAQLEQAKQNSTIPLTGVDTQSLAQALAAEKVKVLADDIYQGQWTAKKNADPALKAASDSFAARAFSDDPEGASAIIDRYEKAQAAYHGIKLRDANFGSDKNPSASIVLTTKLVNGALLGQDVGTAVKAYADHLTYVTSSPGGLSDKTSAKLTQLGNTVVHIPTMNGGTVSTTLSELYQAGRQYADETIDNQQGIPQLGGAMNKGQLMAILNNPGIPLNAKRLTDAATNNYVGGENQPLYPLIMSSETYGTGEHHWLMDVYGPHARRRIETIQGISGTAAGPESIQGASGLGNKVGKLLNEAGSILWHLVPGTQRPSEDYRQIERLTKRFTDQIQKGATVATLKATAQKIEELTSVDPSTEINYLPTTASSRLDILRNMINAGVVSYQGGDWLSLLDNVNTTMSAVRPGLTSSATSSTLNTVGSGAASTGASTTTVPLGTPLGTPLVGKKQ